MEFSVAPWLLATAACLVAYVIWFCRLAAGLSGPRMWPLVGSLPGLILNADRFHDWIADDLRVTDHGTYQTCICAVPLLARRQGLLTVTCDPRNLEHVLQTRFSNYPKGPTWNAVFHDLLGDGIFNSDGASWQLQRKTAAPEFSTRSLRLAMPHCLSRSIHQRLLPILHSAVVSNVAVDLQDLLLRLTFDNICGLICGHDPETLAAELPANVFASSFDRATEATLRRLILPEFVWRFNKRFQLSTEASLTLSVAGIQLYLSNIINARRLELNSGNDYLLSRFLRAGTYSDDKFLIHVALNFILAGRDTSSVALSWFFWLVATHAEVERAILDELCSVLAASRGDDDRKSWLVAPLSFEELDQLVYLKAALSETLRLYPSVPEDTKHVVSDDVLPDGTFVPAGSSFIYSIYSVGRMKTLWGDDCLKFRPERWLSADNRRYEPPEDSFKFVAFNAGPRMCLGKNLAYLQMKSIAASVLLRYRFTVAPDHLIEQKMSLTLFMKYGLRVHVQHAQLYK